LGPEDDTMKARPSHVCLCFTSRIRRVLPLLFSLVTPGAIGFGATFVDGFEGATLDPFWTVTQQSGAITYNGTTVHAGAQSLQFSSTVTGQNKYLLLAHQFPSLQEGEVSVWLYDTGAPSGNANTMYLYLVTASGDGMYILGPDHGSALYGYGMDGWGSYNNSVARTVGWHEFRMLGKANERKLWVDGTLIYSDTGEGRFDLVQFGMIAPDWRPAWTSYFDDFSVNSVPEPGSTLAVASLGLLGFAAMRRLRRA